MFGSLSRPGEPLLQSFDVFGKVMDGDEKTLLRVWASPDGVFPRLRGNWAFDRSVDGRNLMQGSASFSDVADGSLAYHEQGLMRLEGGAFQAERRYVYAGKPDGFAVFFAETPLRLFHEIRLEMTSGNMAGGASHLCSADLYRSDYAFLPDGTFMVRHEVKGPKKDYVLTTSFMRV
jgi:hypothetical protein